MSICPSCKTSFSCTPSGNCFCMDYPKILTPDENASCLCPTCLHKAIQEKIASIISSGDTETPASLGPPKSLKEGIDYTINENGLYVFSRWYHLRRGYCCGSGCQECPYA